MDFGKKYQVPPSLNFQPVCTYAKIGCRNNDGDTALHVAKKFSIVHQLVRFGGDHQIQNEGGKTASDLAESQGRQNIARYLLSDYTEIRSENFRITKL
jgi:ankyrin repeat protein